MQENGGETKIQLARQQENDLVSHFHEDGGDGPPRRRDIKAALWRRENQHCSGEKSPIVGEIAQWRKEKHTVEKSPHRRDSRPAL